MNVVQLLTAAKAKINTPEKWCRSVLARDAEGKCIGERDPKACQWCMVGSVFAVTGFSDDTGEAFDLLEKASDRHIPSFNDAVNTTHADVMAAFDKAIALAKQEAACSSS